MDLLKNLLESKAGDLASGLVSKAGFSADQAKAFVPEAAGSVVNAVKGSDKIDFTNMGTSVQAVIGRIDIASLAGKTGIGATQAKSGLAVIVPALLKLLEEKAGGAAGITSMLGGLKGAGGLGKVVGGAGKLFGR